MKWIAQSQLHSLLRLTRGHAEVIELLVKNGAGVNKKNWAGSFPLLIASQNWNAEIAKVLSNLKANVDAKK